MTSYWRAPEVEQIARRLIAEHHQHLATVPIRYVFRDKATKSRGRSVLGKARKSTGLNAHLVHLVRHDEVDPDEVDFFIIEIAHDTWQLLKPEQQEALVDHELCHLQVQIPDDPNKTRQLVLVGHDLEEFAQVVARHGLWRPAVQEFAQVARDRAQLTLAEGAAMDDEEADDA